MREPLEPMRPVSVGEDVPPDRRAQLLDAALWLCGIATGSLDYVAAQQSGALDRAHRGPMHPILLVQLFAQLRQRARQQS